MMEESQVQRRWKKGLQRVRVKQDTNQFREDQKQKLSLVLQGQSTNLL